MKLSGPQNERKSTPVFFRECPCGKKIDAARESCPWCGTLYDDAGTRRFARLCPLGVYKELALFLVGFVGFQLLGLFFQLLGQANAQDVLVGSGLTGGSLYQALEDYLASAAYLSFVNYGAYFGLFLVMLAILWPDLSYIARRQLRRVSNYAWGLLLGVALIVASILWNMVVLSLGGGQAENQEAVVGIVEYSPFLAVLITGIIGPICEEFAYRVGLFNLGMRIHPAVAYLFATLVFGLIHMHDFASLNEWLNFPSYLIAGGILAFAYHRFGLAGSATAHVLNNLYAVVVTLLV